MRREVGFFTLATIFGVSVCGNVSEELLPQRTSMKDLTVLRLDDGFLCNAEIVDQPLNNKCCKSLKRKMTKEWFGKGQYLTSYLTTLKSWNCSEFMKECKKPSFGFTGFTRLTYDLYCEPFKVYTKCNGGLQRLSDGYKFNITNNGTFDNEEQQWKQLASSLDPDRMTTTDLTKPCVSVALFDRASRKIGSFHEIIETFIPFCELHWTGYDSDTAMKRLISPWDIMSSRCQAGVLVCMILATLIGLGIVFANITVVYVLFVTPKLRNSQGLFQFSVAVGDLLVGLAVFPNILVFHYLSFFTPRTMGNKIVLDSNVTGQDAIDNVLRHPGKSNSYLRLWHVQLIGFFTIMSLTTSIYSLLFASVDRFLAIHRPLRYSRHDAKRFAKVSCGLVWILSVVLSLLPILVPGLQYELISSIIVTAEGNDAITFLSVTFLIPLVVLWIISISTYRSIMKHAENRKRLTNHISTHELQVKLFKVLSVMVGVFSVCTVPTIVVLLLVHFLPNVTFDQPKTLNLRAAMIYNSCEYTAALVLLTNSLWNYFIYSARNKEFVAASKNFYGVLGKKLGFQYIYRKIASIFSSAVEMRQRLKAAKKSRVATEVAAFTQITQTTTSNCIDSVRPSNERDVPHKNSGGKEVSTDLNT